MRTVANWLVLVLIFVIPWENTIVLEGVGTVSRIIGLLTALVWAAASLWSRELRQPGLFHAAVAGFVCWSIFTGIWTIDQAASEQRILTFVQLAVLVLMVWDLLRDRWALEAGLQAYVLGAYVSVGSILISYSDTPAAEGDRFAAVGFNPNDVALVLVLGLPVAWYLLLYGVRRWKLLAAVNSVYLIVATQAILLTGSRAAAAAIVPVLLFCLNSLPRLTWRARVAFGGGIAVVVFGVLTIVPSSTFARIQSTPSVVVVGDPAQSGIGELQSRAGGRADIWAEGLEVFFAHPLLGVGAGAFDSTNMEDTSAHNGFLAVLVEQGLVGLALFAMVCGLAVYHAVRQAPASRWLWLVVLSGLASAMLTHNWEMRKQTWLFLGLIVVSGSFREDRTRSVPKSMSARTRWRPPATVEREQRKLAIDRRRRAFPRERRGGAGAP